MGIKYKEDRIHDIETAITNMKNLMELYRQASPAWTVLNTSIVFLNSICHLEKDATFDSETLGVKK